VVAADFLTIWPSPFRYRTRQKDEVGRRKRAPWVLRGLPLLLIDSSIHKEFSPPLFKFGMLNRMARPHHSEMGNLLSLDVGIHQRRTDTKKTGSGPHICGDFEALDLVLVDRLYRPEE
jgi:hypothetical protein